MLENLNNLLGIEAADKSRDKTLLLLLTMATARLKLLLGGIEPPAELSHIIVEVSVIRFNRIGSEGLSSHSVEGETLSFVDDDFAAFGDEIQAFLNTQKQSTKGKVRFI